MKKRNLVVLAGVLLAGSGAAAFATLAIPAQEAFAVSDPRQEPPIVRLVTATPVTGSERSFTGIVGAKVESNLGFRVPGKIVERLVDVGQQVKAGQPLMRIDDTDLRLALTAKRNAVSAARAIVVQAEPDERRYASLLKDGWVPRQRYEQAQAALDTARAQLAAAEAEARVTENEAVLRQLCMVWGVRGIAIPKIVGTDDLFTMVENVLITPHSAGETDRYEANVIDLFLENLARLERGERLVNAVV